MIGLLPVIIACAHMPEGDRCGSWVGNEFYRDPIICEADLQASMETLIEDTHRMRGYVYWINGKCVEVTRRKAE